MRHARAILTTAAPIVLPVAAYSQGLFNDTIGKIFNAGVDRDSGLDRNFWRRCNPKIPRCAF
jgi:hypothetical protein